MHIVIVIQSTLQTRIVLVVHLVMDHGAIHVIHTAQAVCMALA